MPLLDKVDWFGLSDCSAVWAACEPCFPGLELPPASASGSFWFDKGPQDNRNKEMKRIRWVISSTAVWWAFMMMRLSFQTTKMTIFKKEVAGSIVG